MAQQTGRAQGRKDPREPEHLQDATDREGQTSGQKQIPRWRENGASRPRLEVSSKKSEGRVRGSCVTHHSAAQSGGLGEWSP